jgi:hypothetical protein
MTDFSGGCTDSVESRYNDSNLSSERSGSELHSRGFDGVLSRYSLSKLYM